MTRSRRDQRSQAMTEFALVAPVLLLLTFGIIDFGRALYFYVIADAAAQDGARVAARTLATQQLPTQQLPSNAAVQNAISSHFPGATVVPYLTCYNGPIPNSSPPNNDAYFFITEASPTIGQSPQSNPPFTTANAPGGEIPVAATSSCSAINPAIGRQQLEVTVEYNYVPVTPLISNLLGGHIIFRLQATTRTEY